MKQKPRTCNACPHRHRGIGFAKDHTPRAGARKAKAAFHLEGPGSGEVQYVDPSDGYGRPLVGKSGELFDLLCLLPTGLERHSIIISNTLRCHSPRNEYPTETLRITAERSCRQYDDALVDFSPTCVGVTYHPAAVFRVPSYGAFIAAAAMKVSKLVEAGERPLLLMGLKGFQARGLEWLRKGNVDPTWSMKKLQGHFWRLK